MTLFKAYTSDDIEALRSIFKLYNGKLIVNDIMLTKMISKAYSDYTSPYIYFANPKHYKKDTISVFRGTKDDMADIFMNEIVEIFDERKTIKNEKSLYKYIKYRVIATVNDMLKANDTSIETNPIINCQGTDDCFDLTDNVAYNNHQQHNDYNHILGDAPAHGYSSIMLEALGIIRSNNIKDMLRPDARLTRDLIDLIMHNSGVIDNEGKLIKESQLADMIADRYGYRPPENKICEALDLVYSVLIRCIYGNVPMSRAKYCKASIQADYDIEQKEDEHIKKTMRERDKFEAKVQDDSDNGLY